MAAEYFFEDRYSKAFKFLHHEVVIIIKMVMMKKSDDSWDSLSTY